MDLGVSLKRGLQLIKSVITLYRKNTSGERRGEVGLFKWEPLELYLTKLIGSELLILIKCRGYLASSWKAYSSLPSNSQTPWESVNWSVEPPSSGTPLLLSRPQLEDMLNNCFIVPSRLSCIEEPNMICRRSVLGPNSDCGRCQTAGQIHESSVVFFISGNCECYSVTWVPMKQLSLNRLDSCILFLSGSFRTTIM